MHHLEILGDRRRFASIAELRETVVRAALKRVAPRS